MVDDISDESKSYYIMVREVNVKVMAKLMVRARVQWQIGKEFLFFALEVGG